MYVSHQAYQNNLKLKNSQLCKSRKEKKYPLNKLHAVKCVIQSFSSVITENFMKTIIVYRWTIEDA